MNANKSIKKNISAAENDQFADEDEDESEDEITVPTPQPRKKKKNAVKAKKIRNKKMREMEEREKLVMLSMTAEEKYTEKMKRQKLVEEADHKLTEELFEGIDVVPSSSGMDSVVSTSSPRHGSENPLISNRNKYL